MFVVEYFDPTRGRDGDFCLRSAFRRLSRGEMKWAYESVLAPLNDAVRAAAERHGWTAVSGVSQVFGRNGYCTGDADRYIRTIQESVRFQRLSFGSILRRLGPALSGAFHPNEAGHLATAGRIVPALQLALPPVTSASAAEIAEIPDPNAPSPSGAYELVPAGETAEEDNDLSLWIAVPIALVLLAALVLSLSMGADPIVAPLAAGALLIYGALLLEDTIELALALAIPGALAIAAAPVMRWLTMRERRRFELAMRGRDTP